MIDNWQESWDRMEEAERRNRDIGEHRQQEAESLVEVAREREADEKLMREAMEALEPYVLLGEQLHGAVHGYEWPKSYGLLKARKAVKNLEERLLRE